MKWYTFISCLIVFIFLGCDASNTATSSTETTSEEGTKAMTGDLRIAFYNVENLFDTKDAPNKPDEEYMPNSEKKWTTERYSKKLDQLGKVIEAMGSPALIGVCEVENEQVLLDLAANDQLKNGNYGVAHKESNDYRGIDNALLYNKDLFTVTSIDNVVLEFPRKITGGQNYTSRDIFHVTGKLADNTTLHVFVNHFPSRRGGLKASEPKRLFVAGELRKEVEKVMSKDDNSQIVIMGDFNDETDNKSITKVLKAISADTDAPDELVNCFAGFDAEDKGSYNYRGTWNMLDQIILSDNFYNSNGEWSFSDAVIFQEKWMMYNDPRNGSMPSRTYGGPNYYGGFSDHLPVYVDLKK
jgi:predicted extracellular nuclease